MTNFEGRDALVRQAEFFRRLQANTDFQSYVIEPFRTMRKRYEAALIDPLRALDELRVAQGALEVIRTFERMFEIPQARLEQQIKGPNVRKHRNRDTTDTKHS